MIVTRNATEPHSVDVMLLHHIHHLEMTGHYWCINRAMIGMVFFDCSWCVMCYYDVMCCSLPHNFILSPCTCQCFVEFLYVPPQQMTGHWLLRGGVIVWLWIFVGSWLWIVAWVDTRGICRLHYPFWLTTHPAHTTLSEGDASISISVRISWTSY